MGRIQNWHSILSGGKHWNSLIKYARGEFFIYAGAHDLWSTNFLSSLVDLLDQNQSAVLAYAPADWIDEAGNNLERHTDFSDTSGLTAFVRFNLLIWTGQDALYGLIRLSAIKCTRLQKEIVGSGAVWLSELSLLGEFTVSLEAKRYRRTNRDESTRDERLDRYHRTLFSKPRKRVLPYWRLPVAYLGASLTGDFAIRKKLHIMIAGFLNSLIRYGLQMSIDLASLAARPLKR